MNYGECENELCIWNRKQNPGLECDGSEDEWTHCESCFYLFSLECPQCGQHNETKLCPNCTIQPVDCEHV
jgi:hypothetical protein